MPQFTLHNQTEQADSLANKMPQGKAWIDKFENDTVMRNLLIGYGLEYIRLESNLNYTDDELSLIRTQDLINEWEIEYGIDKSCFATQDKSDLQQRIQNILVMIASNGTSTAEQFEAIALLLGVNVTVEAGTALLTTFSMTFPFTFYNDLIDARYTILVTLPSNVTSNFTLEFTFIFGSQLATLLKCFFNILKPANCRIIYV
jgi:uncharacterized protein YmfQ (DUF2313 family)